MERIKKGDLVTIKPRYCLSSRGVGLIIDVEFVAAATPYNAKVLWPNGDVEKSFVPLLWKVYP